MVGLGFGLLLKAVVLNLKWVFMKSIFLQGSQE